MDKNEPWTSIGEHFECASKWQTNPLLLPTFPLLPSHFVVQNRDSVHRYVHERHFVPDEVSVYVCEQHRPVGLEVPGAFWNDVVGRGRFSPEQHEYDRHRSRAEAWFPLYRPSPTAPLFSMADGQSYRRSTNCNFTRTKSPTSQARLEKLQLRLRRASETR